MHRIDGPGATIDNKFTEGDPVGGVQATLVTDDWMNDVQEELMSVLASAGIAPVKGVQTQLLTAIRTVARHPAILSDTGSASNSYSATNVPPYTGATLIGGTLQTLKFAHGNTGASSYRPDGIGPFPIYGLNLAPLKGGEIPLAGIGTMLFVVDASVNSGNGAFVLLSCTGGALQIPPASYGDHAIQLQQATGRLIGVRTFVTSGTYTPTPGMVSYIIEAQGGGGSGGGATVPSAGNVSLGAPGGAGSYGKWRGFAASIGAGQAITIGGPGTVGSGVAGGNGGTTSVGALYSAPGGIGGSILNNQVPPQYNSNVTASGNPTGASISVSLGVAGSASSGPTPGSGLGGTGGSSAFGSGGLGGSINSAGTQSPNYGAGGAGCACGSGGTAITGAQGKSGIVIIWEYA